MPNPILSDRLAPNRESWRPERSAYDAGPLLRRAALIVAAVACFGAVVGVAASLLRGHSHGVPVIEADRSPVRVKPDNPGGMQISNEEQQIMDGSDAAHADVMAPGPETPQPQALAAEIQAARPAPAAPPAAPSVPSVAPLAAPSAAAVTPPALAVPPPVHAAPSVQDAGKAGAGKMEVQLAAMTTRDGAVAEWARLAKKMPELLGHRRSDIVQTEVDGKMYFRLRTGGFADAASATVFCNEMRDKGAACAVARS